MKQIPLALLAILAAEPCLAQSLTWKTEKQLGPAAPIATECSPAAKGNCADAVPYQSASVNGMNMYVTYLEGERMAVGIGSTQHQAGQFYAEQLHPTGVDWGGIETNGTFEPRYAIKRFYQYDAAEDEVSNAVTMLVLFRLRPDGTSCIVDTGDAKTPINARARRWAEEDLKSPRCVE